MPNALSPPTTGPPRDFASGIIASARDAIITINAQQRVVLFNDAAARMFRLAAEQALGQPLDQLIPLRSREEHRSHVARYAEGDGVARTMNPVRALTGLRSDGTEFPIEASISRQSNGAEALMTVMVRDVTEVREAERERQEHAARDAANRAKAEFLARMSHELRTPLNAVLGMGQLLMSNLNERLNEKEQDQFDRLLSAGQQLNTLIDNVLDLTRLDAGEIRLDAREINLCGLIDEAVAENSELAMAHQVQVQVALSLERSFVMQADPARLRQVISALLSNGIKFHRQGGLVRVEARRESNCVLINVIDNGRGMTPEQQAVLFEPFTRVESARSNIDGMGIGMALTRQLLLLMGGKLHVQSEPGQGTSIQVRLPIRGRNAEPTGTVLYIEDNPVNALLVVQVLSQWPKVRVVIAEDGATGLEQARRLEPQLVLLDMQLPDMHGLHVLEQLKANPATRKLRVVALSANAVESDAAATLRSGAIDYWTKPIKFAPFLENVRALLREHCID